MGRPLFGYMTMEAAFQPHWPTYAGGLGVLAGDMLKSAADLGLDGVGILPIYPKGYFEQRFENGWQKEDYPLFDPSSIPGMQRLDDVVYVRNENRDMKIGAWRYDLRGQHGHEFPLIFLTSRVPGNHERDFGLLDHLYGGDENTRIRQEMALGIGGVRMLQALGLEPQTFHENEGHAAFAGLELLNQGMPLEAVRGRIAYTTHTPVPAGHDRFTHTLMEEVMKGYLYDGLRQQLKELSADKTCPDKINMTHLAVNTARYINAVSKLHGEVMRKMLDNPNVDSITNGVHPYTWTSEPFKQLFDQYLPEWRKDPAVLEKVGQIPRNALLHAHFQAKLNLFDAINNGDVIKTTDEPFDPTLLTIGFARRGATYKRADLAFHDLEKLAEVGQGRLQFVFAGKAHPNDAGGKTMLQNVQNYAKALKGRVNVAFLQNYNMGVGQLLTSGCDVWLNAPIVGDEASGTSGMKAALNGVGHFSTFDGWWREYAHQGGWTFGDHDRSDRERDFASFIDVLKHQVMPAYGNPNAWVEQMRGGIRNGSHANTHRSMKEYVEKAYGGQMPKEHTVFNIPMDVVHQAPGAKVNGVALPPTETSSMVQ